MGPFTAASLLVGEMLLDQTQLVNVSVQDIIRVHTTSACPGCLNEQADAGEVMLVQSASLMLARLAANPAGSRSSKGPAFMSSAQGLLVLLPAEPGRQSVSELLDVGDRRFFL